MIFQKFSKNCSKVLGFLGKFTKRFASNSVFVPVFYSQASEDQSAEQSQSLEVKSQSDFVQTAVLSEKVKDSVLPGSHDLVGLSLVVNDGFTPSQVVSLANIEGLIWDLFMENF